MKAIYSSLLPLTSLAPVLTLAATDPYCENAAAIQARSPVLAGETLACLDGAVAKNAETVVFYDTAAGNPRVFVAKSNLRQGKPSGTVAVWRLDQAELFPRHCGGALEGARVLPGSTRIALLYGQDVIRIVDTRNGNVVETIDHREPNSFSTCFGSAPSAVARRDEVAVVAQKRRLDYVYRDWSQVTEECQTWTLSDEERARLSERIDAAQESLARIRAENPNDSRIPRLMMQLANDRGSLRNGRREGNCTRTAAKVSGQYKY